MKNLLRAIFNNANINIPNGLPQGMRKVTLVEDMSDLGNMSWLKAVKVPTGNNCDENQVKILGLYPMKQEPTCDLIIGNHLPLGG